MIHETGRSDTDVVVRAIAVSSVLQDCEILVAFDHGSKILPRLTLLEAFSFLVYTIFVVPRLRSDRLEGWMLRDVFHLITAMCQSRYGGSQCCRRGVVDAAAAKGEHRHPERVGWYHWTVDVSGKQETERILAGIHP